MVVPVTQGRRDLADALHSLGARVVEVEFIEIAATADPAGLAAAVARWCDGDYAWMAVTSRNALSAVEAAASRAGHDLSSPMPPARVAVVGEATARASAAIGLDVALIPTQQQSVAGLVHDFPEGEGRVLAPLGNLAGDALARGLAAKGWTVDSVEAYRTVDGPGMDADAVADVATGKVDAVILTSGSVARRFSAQCSTYAQCSRDAERSTDPQRAVVAHGVAVVAIGESTAAAARAAGLEVTTVAATPDDDGVAAALRRALEGATE